MEEEYTQRSSDPARRYLGIIYRLYPPSRCIPEYALAVNVARKYNCRSVLDIGCGAGNLFKILADSVTIERYVGIDVLDIFRIKNPKVTFVKADAKHPPNWLLNQRFDCVFFINSLFYISVDVLKIYGELGRYLMVIDIDPRIRYPHIYLLNLLEGRIRTTSMKLEEIVRKMGFKIIEKRNGMTYCLVLTRTDVSLN
ncbi:MAG: class I SAM-dependent methyltransferase [Ignisphaera sp.]